MVRRGNKCGLPAVEPIPNKWYCNKEGVENISDKHRKNGSLFLSVTSERFTRQSGSRRVFIWRENGARFHSSYVTNFDRFGGKGSFVRGSIMLRSRTSLYVFYAGNVNSHHYKDEILEACGTFQRLKKCFAAGFELITNNCESLKEVVSLDSKKQVGQIGESLVKWGEAMRPSEDADTNGCIVADFSVMVVVDIGSQQMGSTNLASNCVLTIIEDVSEDTPGSLPILLFTIACHTGAQPGVMVWSAISFYSRTPLVVIRGTLTSQWYVDDILRTVLLLFPGLIIQQDDAGPHTARVTMNCLSAYKTLSWPA
ncbi:transposable element Tc1 transposase [Trichonephila clavipes]|nr:transposable element Tc1 transposase [Trichonephila clavipes]